MKSKLQLWLLSFFLAGLNNGAAQPGTKAWEFRTGGRVYSAPAIGSDGTLYFGSLDKKVYALNPNGTKRWEFLTDDAVASSPALGADETVYVGSRDRKLYALTATGVKRWEFATGGRVDSSPAVGVDGTIYVGSRDAKLYALAPDGTKKWEFVTGDEIFSSPAVAVDGTVFVGSRDAKLYALAPDGVKKWEFATRGPIDASPALGLRGVIYVASNDGRLYALNPDGSKQWEFVATSPLYSSPAVGVDGTIYVAEHSGKLYAVTPAGVKKWQATTTNQVDYASLALAADGTIYVGVGTGRLQAFNADGTPKWFFQAGGEIEFCSPVIAANGTVYIGANDGKLYAVNGSAGPASALWPMFRRDARHSASGFVERSLPSAYSPGAKMRIKLRALPPAGVTTYAVEDSPPANWQVAEPSDNGFFDATTRRVRFGPFFDALARELTYTATPPAGESGAKQFNGTSWTLEGAERLVGGDQVFGVVPLHPADTSAVDGWMTIGEMTAYGAAWKRGSPWPNAPSPIPLGHLTRAVQLWESGETYRFDTNFATAPQWWISSPTNHLSTVTPVPEFPAKAVATNGVSVSAMPKTYQPGVPFTVTLTITPATNIVVYAVEEQAPEGWLLSAIDLGGGVDAARRKVKWGPFFDSAARTFTYQVTPPADASATGRFLGLGAFDGQIGALAGRRQIFLESETNAPTLGAAKVSADGAVQFALTGLGGESYAIQASTNLLDWSPLATITNLTGTVKFSDSAATNYTQRFFRAVWP